MTCTIEYTCFFIFSALSPCTHVAPKPVVPVTGFPSLPRPRAPCSLSLSLSYHSLPPPHTHNNNMTLEPDALILVTGANGLLSSHIIEQTLASSPTLRVRGAVRSEAKVAPLKKKWQDKYGKERFMTVVLDFMSPEAYTKSGALLGQSTETRLDDSTRLH